MTMLMTPIMSPPDSEIKITPRNLEKAESGSFARHLEKKLDEAYHKKRDMLGVKERHPVKQRNQSSSDKSECETDETERESLVGLLAEFMDDLNKIAEGKDFGPGEWNVAPDSSLLSEICAAAGLDPAELSLLTEQAGSEGGKLEIGDLLALLSDHFETMGSEKKITVAETDLPLLNVFLTQFGLPQEQIQGISEAAVRGDGTFDLDLFLQGLRKAEAGGIDQEQTVILTDWEAEQLQDILTRAGVTRGAQLDLLPERIFQGQPVELSLNRLQSILEGGIQDIRIREAGIKLPEFLKSLGQMLTQAGFESKNVGWTPVVQESINAFFQKLQEIVDLSQAGFHENQALDNGKFKQDMERLDWLSRIVLEQEAGIKQPEFLERLRQMLSQAGSGSKEVGWTPAEQESLNAFSQKFQKTIDLSQVRFHEDLALETENFEQAMARLEGLSRIVPAEEVGSKLNITNLRLDQSSVIQTGVDSEATSFKMPLTSASPTADSALNQAPEIRESSLPRSVQQQMPLTSQLSNSIANGIKNQDHHLLIKLYPADLGEVKIKLHVRDDQVAVSFNMENSKVKEMLESHMQEFRDNMEQKGFSLGECSVSVGQQHDDTGEAWQRFEQTWTSESDMEDQPGISEEIDFYRTRNKLTDQDNGISLMV